MNKTKVIMHIDLNAFFATAEVINNPELKGKPIAVAGLTKRGIVSTASYEARAFGVRSAMPTYMAKRLCPKLIICSSNFKLYSTLSKKFFSFIKQRTSIIEIASIDECYADMTETLKDVKNVQKYLIDMQEELLQVTQLPCSIGIGPTKFLAKMASDMKKPLGITILRRRDIKTKLWPLPIGSMFGIGKKSAPRLKAVGINTIGDLANSNQDEVKRILGVSYYTYHDWANGRGNDVVDIEPFDPKSISHSSTFLDDTNDYDEIKTMIADLSKSVIKEAKKDDKLGTTVQITIKNADFTSHTRASTVKKPFNDYETLFNKAMILFDKNYNNQLIRLVGVALQNLVDRQDSVVQMSLFDYANHEEEAKTTLLVNELNRKFEKPVFKKASDIKKIKK